VPRRFVETVTALGLLPVPTHERVRNIVVSPLTGRLGGAADLRTTARLLDEGLRADPALAALPARFLFCLDDRGDLHDRPCDLAAVAVDQGRARLVAAGLGGKVVDLEDVPRLLLGLARRFVELRGTGPTAPWHVSELPARGGELGPFHPAAHPAAHPPAHPPAHPAGAPAPVAAPPYGRLVQDDGRALLHVPVPDGVLTPALLDQVLASAGDTVVVTPWRSLVLPDLEVPA
jgi:precorrin-3B synthase